MEPREPLGGGGLLPFPPFLTPPRPHGRAPSPHPVHTFKNIFLANEILKYKIPFIFQTNGTGSDVPWSPERCGRQDVGGGQWGRLNKGDVCGVWVRQLSVGPRCSRLCLGSLGLASSHYPQCLPHGPPLQGCPRFLSSTCKLRGFFFNSTPFPVHTPTGGHFFAISTFLSLALVLMPLSSPNLTFAHCSQQPLSPKARGLQEVVGAH